MKGLSGSRVLLLDDKADEALPVVKAFSQIGVPVAYFDGTTNTPTPRRRVRGVRLAILDMNLGVTGSEETIASTLVQTLSQIMSGDNGPYGVLIWTGHPHLKSLVSRYLFQHPSLPKPVFVEMMKKATFRRVAADGTQRFAMKKLSNALVTTLTEHSPLECLQAWEVDANHGRRSTRDKGASRPLSRVSEARATAPGSQRWINGSSLRASTAKR